MVDFKSTPLEPLALQARVVQFVDHLEDFSPGNPGRVAELGGTGVR